MAEAFNLLKTSPDDFEALLNGPCTPGNAASASKPPPAYEPYDPEEYKADPSQALLSRVQQLEAELAKERQAHAKTRKTLDEERNARQVTAPRSAPASAGAAASPELTKPLAEERAAHASTAEVQKLLARVAVEGQRRHEAQLAASAAKAKRELGEEKKSHAATAEIQQILARVAVGSNRKLDESEAQRTKLASVAAELQTKLQDEQSAHATTYEIQKLLAKVAMDSQRRLEEEKGGASPSKNSASGETSEASTRDSTRLKWQEEKEEEAQVKAAATKPGAGGKRNGGKGKANGKGNS